MLSKNIFFRYYWSPILGTEMGSWKFCSAHRNDVQNKNMQSSFELFFSFIFRSLLNLILAIQVNSPMQWSPRSKHSIFSQGSQSQNNKIKNKNKHKTQKNNGDTSTRQHNKFLHKGYMEITVKSSIRSVLQCFLPLKFTNTMVTIASLLEQCRSVRNAAVHHPGWQVTKCMQLLSISSEEVDKRGQGERKRMHS